MPPTPTEPTPTPVSVKTCPWYQLLCQVTPVSKYLAMFIFVAMPFVGGYVGYRLAGDAVTSDLYKELYIQENNINEIIQQENSQIGIKNTGTTYFGCSSIIDSVEIFPELSEMKSGDMFGAFTFATSSIERTCKSSQGRDYRNTHVTLTYTGTTTLRGHIVVSMNELGGSIGDAGYLVRFIVDDVDLHKIPLDFDGSIMRDLYINGLRQDPFVQKVVDQCTPGEYCTLLRDIGTSENMLITVSNFYRHLREFGGDTYGIPHQTDLVID
jgi:hypothetical protein